jgi:hypothetical protein
VVDRYERYRRNYGRGAVNKDADRDQIKNEKLLNGGRRDSSVGKPTTLWAGRVPVPRLDKNFIRSPKI